MSDLYDTITRIVRQELQSQRAAEIAVVQEIHPHASDGSTDNQSCTVVLRDSRIVLKRVPVASSRLGVAAIPDIGDVVLLQFVGGDINAPVIVGSLYNENSRPPVNEEGQFVLHLPQGSGAGSGVHLVADSANGTSVKLNLGSAVALTLQDDDPVVSLEVDGGGATLLIERDGSITIESQTNIVMKGGGNVDIEAAGQLNLKGATINLN